MINIGNRYIIINEDTPQCEWGTFLKGKYCTNEGTKAIVDTKDKHETRRDKDGKNITGFHEAHLCERHIQGAYNLITRG